MTNKQAVPVFGLLISTMLLISFIGCSEEPTSTVGDNDQPSETETKKTSEENSQSENSEQTHVVTSAAEYYKGGPQQAQPPDGKFPAGTKVTLIREAGSYSLVQSEDGIEAYVSTGSLKSTNGTKTDDKKSETVDGKPQGPAFPPLPEC